MKINVETIPHSCQRYDTVGDWTFEEDGSLNVNVSQMICKQPVNVGTVSSPINTHLQIENEDSEFLVSIHEIIEAYLCKKAGITAEQVDRWDMNFKNLAGSYLSEPGNDPRAPYHVQHLIAQSIEMMLCSQLKLDWNDHCKVVEEVK